MQQLFTKTYHPIPLVVIGISLILSGWGLWVDDVINNDGVEYVGAAKYFMAGDWVSAVKLYKWPFYPAVIALVAKVTFLSPEHAAHLINAIAFTALCLAFLAAIIELGGTRLTVVCAAFVVLLFPAINEYRAFVIREPGYLCFYMLGLMYLFRFQNTLKWWHIAMCLLCMLIAGLFRVEGIVFVVLIPWVIAVLRRQSPSGRLKLFVWLVPLLLIALVGLGWWITASTPSAVENVFDRPGAVVRQSLSLIVDRIAEKLFILRQDLLGQFGSNYAVPVFFLAIIYVVLIETTGALTIWYAALVAWVMYRGLVFPAKNQLRLWLWLLVINVLILFAFTLINLFLTGRYPLALALTLALAIPFGVARLYEQWKLTTASSSRSSRWLFPALVIVMLLAGLEALDLGTEKRHIKQAGRWIADQNDAKTLYTNNKILSHYTNINYPRLLLEDQWSFVVRSLEKGVAGNYDYVAIRLKSKEMYRRDRLFKVMGNKPVKEFVNRKNDTVYVFKR